MYFKKLAENSKNSLQWVKDRILLTVFELNSFELNKPNNNKEKETMYQQFKEMFSKEIIEIQKNKLKIFNQEILSKLPQLKYVYYTGNEKTISSYLENRELLLDQHPFFGDINEDEEINKEALLKGPKHCDLPLIEVLLAAAADYDENFYKGLTIKNYVNLNKKGNLFYINFYEGFLNFFNNIVSKAYDVSPNESLYLWLNNIDEIGDNSPNTFLDYIEVFLYIENKKTINLGRLEVDKVDETDKADF